MSFKKAAGFSLVRNDAQYLYDKSLTMNAAIKTWMARNAYPMYQNAQKKRWMTQNASEGTTWKAVSPKYQKRKDRLLASEPEKYPGGKRVMVLTGALADSVTGKKLDFHRAIFTERGFTVATTLPYAKYANEARPFVGFSNQTTDRITKSLKSFILKHISKGAQ